jgi:hypothetical protein
MPADTGRSGVKTKPAVMLAGPPATQGATDTRAGNPALLFVAEIGFNVRFKNGRFRRRENQHASRNDRRFIRHYANCTAASADSVSRKIESEAPQPVEGTARTSKPAMPFRG